MTETKKAIKTAFILEDQPETMDWLKAVLCRSFDQLEVHCSTSVADAIDLLATVEPDLALIDLGLPDGTGLTVVRYLQENIPQCLRVVSTAFSDDAHLFTALQSGAQGYILKEQDQAQMGALLQSTANGQPPLSASIARRILGHFQPQSVQVELTARQTDVLRLIARGYKNREVAEYLEISEHTVHGYIKDIYRLLDISSRAEATIEASKRGLIGPDCS
ncbi:MAG: response regulator [bacterium]